MKQKQDKTEKEEKQISWKRPWVQPHVSNETDEYFMCKSFMVEIKKRKYHEPKAGVFSDLLHLVPGTSCPLVSTYQQFFERRSHCISDQLPSRLQKGT